MKSISEQLEIIKRGSVELIDEKELIEKLKKGKPLRVKAGFDPTAPDLHLGHTVLINKLKQFQDLGHEVVFLIGDFTAKIGDPSGRSSTRPPLSDDEIKKNVKTYCDQVFKILDSQKTTIDYNSRWLKQLGAEGMILLASRMTVARMLERDDFEKRYHSDQPISLHEFYYPLLQGYDSVALKADVELGGNDQKFNLLMGRQLQKIDGQEPQVILTMPLLLGTDGVQKMSKSYDNYIAIQDTPQDMFGKVLSIGDDLMWKYYELLSFKTWSDVLKMKADVEQGIFHPKAAKVMLAKEIVARFHGEAAAEKAAKDFELVFAKKEIPDEIEECRLPLSAGGLGLLEMLVKTDLASSNTEARKFVIQGAVKIDQKKIDDPKMKCVSKGAIVVQVGKRAFKKVILT